ncbi:MAG: T9SS type A sorting domain-containing protein, partial [Bacteroidales bacterium]
GGMDLAFANNNGGLHVYIFDDWDQLWQDFSGDLPSTGPFEHTQLADMNMDGFIDLAAYGEGTFQVFLGDGNGNWTADATFTTGDPGYSQAFRVGGDVDHNGRPDIVLLEEEELSWFTYQNYLRCYRESSVPILLDIKPVYPRGWERFRPNSVRFIDWISTVPGNEPATVKLEYSTIGSNGPMTLIADGLPNSGRYQWIVPQENSVTCYIRYTITSGTSTYSSTTSRAFMILDGGIGIDEPKPESMGISVYPNPAGRQLTVDSWQSAVKMVITDLFGRRIKECANISSFPFLLDISDLQPGMYILRAINKDGESGSAKFLKISL